MNVNVWPKFPFIMNICPYDIIIFPIKSEDYKPTIIKYEVRYSIFFGNAVWSPNLAKD